MWLPCAVVVAIPSDSTQRSANGTPENSLAMSALATYHISSNLKLSSIVSHGDILCSIKK